MLNNMQAAGHPCFEHSSIKKHFESFPLTSTLPFYTKYHLTVEAWPAHIEIPPFDSREGDRVLRLVSLIKKHHLIGKAWSACKQV